VAGLLLGALAYGSWRLSEDSQTPGPRLALLQGNVDQRLRILGTAEGEASLEARKHIDGHYGALVRLAGRGHPDLVVWPETSLTQHWEEYPPGVPDRDSQRQACDLAAEAGSPVLLGVNSYVVDSDRKLRAYNSAVLVDAVGRWQGRYDKIHRVPFGEYIPVRSLMPWLNSLAPYDFDYSVHPGEAFTRFHLGRERRYTFGVVICYEDTVPDMALPYGGGGPAPADFLLNISNDGWFDGTSEHDQHLALCRFRAVECRRSVARAVNMGISAVIDSNGRVLRPRGIDAPGVPDGMHLWEVPAGGGPELPVSGWGEFKKVAGVLFATVPVDHRSSLYARWGDWLPALCWLLLGGWGVVALLGRPRSVPGLAAAVR
jgi:apolipoprotein N-acyltransferase